jgi:hypothetical protein
MLDHSAAAMAAGTEIVIALHVLLTLSEISVADVCDQPNSAAVGRPHKRV